MTKKKKPTIQQIHAIADKNGLTQKQTRILEEVIDNPNRTGKEIALSAGYASKYASEHGNDIIRNSSVRSAFAELVSAGKFDAKVERFYEDLLNFPVTEDSKLTRVQLDAIKTLHKIAGDYAPTKSLSVSAKFKAPTRE